MARQRDVDHGLARLRFGPGTVWRGHDLAPPRSGPDTSRPIHAFDWPWSDRASQKFSKQFSKNLIFKMFTFLKKFGVSIFCF
jgi:hypothetical protein